MKKIVCLQNNDGDPIEFAQLHTVASISRHDAGMDVVYTLSVTDNGLYFLDTDNGHDGQFYSVSIAELEGVTPEEFCMTCDAY